MARGRCLSQERPDAWEVGDPKWPLPPDRGFDEWYGTPAGAGSYFNPKPLLRTAPSRAGTGRLLLHRRGERRGRADDRACCGRRTAFFLHVCYTAPHWPLHAPVEDIARYQGRYRAGWDAVRTARHEQLKALGIVDRRWPSRRAINRRRGGPTSSSRTGKTVGWQFTRGRSTGWIRGSAGSWRRCAAEHRGRHAGRSFCRTTAAAPNCCTRMAASATRWRTTRDGRPLTFWQRAGLMPGGQRPTKATICRGRMRPTPLPACTSTGCMRAVSRRR